MKHSTLSVVFVLSLLLLLPGCGRLIDWGKQTFYQGQELEVTDIPARYLRSVVAYDQFTTVAMFDALWLSDEVKTAYTNVYMLKCGKSEERKMAFLRRQLEENNHFITFYVLSSYRMVLGEAQSEWMVFLKLDGRCFTPIEIKEIDLDPVYQSFFGKRFNNFKIAYRVKFDAKDADDQPLLVDGTSQCMWLCFRGIEKEVALTWYIPEDGQVYACDRICNGCVQCGDYYADGSCNDELCEDEQEQTDTVFDDACSDNEEV